MGTPTVLLARTDADAADLVTSDVDDNDRPFITGERTVEGFFRTRAGIDRDLARPGLCALCRSDLVRNVHAEPEYARKFAEAIHRQFPGKLLAYNCSPSFNWKKNRTTPPSPSSSASWAPWATSSSSSRWPASTR